MRTTLAFVGALTLTGIADNAGGATTKGCRAPEEAPPPANCPPLPQTARCGGYRCFFISPCHGDDRTGDGSLRRPWKSFRWLTHAGDESQPRAMELRAGDVVQVVDGTIDQSFGAGDGTRALFTAHRVRGRADAPITFKAFSGRTPVLDPGRDGVGLRLLQTSHVVVEGLSVRNACGHGISIEKSQSVTLRNVRVSATDGLDRVEVAGVHVSSSRDVRIDGGQFFDNFDRDAVDTDGEATDNSGNVVFVGGRNASVRNAHLFNTLGNDRSGYCLKYKRASKDPAATFEVVGNRFDNCSFFAVSSGTQNTLVSDNLIVGGAGLVSQDNGALTHQSNQRFVHNTLYLEGPGLEIEMTDAHRTLEFPKDPTGLVFSHNIVVDLRAFYLSDEGIVEIEALASAPRLKRDDTLRLMSNCYSNVRTAARFAFSASPGVRRSAYDIFDWKALGYDEGSVLANPTFVDLYASDFRLTSDSACQGLGTRVFRRIE